jgi:hypothetical protein
MQQPIDTSKMTPAEKKKLLKGEVKKLNSIEEQIEKAKAGLKIELDKVNDKKAKKK